MPDNFFEKTIEDIVYENRAIIHTRGFPKLRTKTFRQIILPSRKKIDVLSYDISEDGIADIDVYELKLDNVNFDTISQAYNYVKELREITTGFFRQAKFTITLVGKRADSNLSIIEIISIPVSVYTYEYSMTGISFVKVPPVGVKSLPDERYSLGMWAWVFKRWEYSKGHPPTHSFYLNDNETKEARCILKERLVEQKLLPAPPIVIEIPLQIKKPVITVVFPEQPAWSAEFAKEIPFGDDIMEDIELGLWLLRNVNTIVGARF